MRRRVTFRHRDTPVASLLVRRLLDDRRGRIVVWVAFVLVHAFLVLQVWTWPLAPFNDVIVVYRDWVALGLTSGAWVGLSLPFVYPPLALAPMVAAAVFGLGSTAYGWGWLLLVVLLDALALAVLTARGDALRRRRETIAAWWWLAFLLLLGPVGLGRLEAITAPLAIIAVRLLLERPAVAGALLAVGAWIKIWPGALLAAALVTLRSGLRVLLGGVVATALILLVGLALGGRAELLGFLAGQADRGLQVESLLAAPWLVAVALGLPGAEVVWNHGINTFEVAGPGVEALAAWSTPVLVVSVLVLLVLGLLARRRDPLAALVPLSVGLVAVLVVTNKVGSPQFTAWLAAPIVLAILLAPPAPVVRDSRAFLPGVLALALAGLTQIVYPTTYDLLLAGYPVIVAILVVKHVLWLVLLGWAVVRLWAIARGNAISRGNAVTVRG